MSRSKEPNCHTHGPERFSMPYHPESPHPRILDHLELIDPEDGIVQEFIRRIRRQSPRSTQTDTDFAYLYKKGQPPSKPEGIFEVFPSYVDPITRELFPSEIQIWRDPKGRATDIHATLRPPCNNDLPRYIQRAMILHPPTCYLTTSSLSLLNGLALLTDGEFAIRADINTGNMLPDGTWSTNWPNRMRVDFTNGFLFELVYATARSIDQTPDAYDLDALQQRLDTFDPSYPYVIAGVTIQSNDLSDAVDRIIDMANQNALNVRSIHDIFHCYYRFGMAE